MTRLFYPPERGTPVNRPAFDPVSEGAHYQLSREASLAVWKRACSDVVMRFGWEDPVEAAQRFHQLSVLLSKHGGRLITDVGRTTRIAVELGGEKLDTVHTALARHTPGRSSLAQVETKAEDDAQSLGADAAARRTAYPRSTSQLGNRADFARHRAPNEDSASARQDPPTARPRAVRRPSTRPSINALFGGAQALRAEHQASERALASADRATQIAEVVRLDRAGELARTLRRGVPGVADAVAAALQDRAIFAPHPVDQ
jgi:hypothetical protein